MRQYLDAKRACAYRDVTNVQLIQRFYVDAHK